MTPTNIYCGEDAVARGEAVTAYESDITCGNCKVALAEARAAQEVMAHVKKGSPLWAEATKQAFDDAWKYFKKESR